MKKVVGRSTGCGKDVVYVAGERHSKPNLINNDGNRSGEPICGSRRTIDYAPSSYSFEHRVVLNSCFLPTVSLVFWDYDREYNYQLLHIQ